MSEEISLKDLFCRLVRDLKVSIVPIIPGEKRPGEYVKGEWRGMQGWERYAERFPTEIELEHWTNWPLTSLGVLTGELSRLIAVDFDNREDIHAEILKLIPDSPIKKRGAKGFTAFYQYSGEENKKWSLEGETIVEILSNGRQTLIPPSIHPTGEEYQWLQEETLDNYDLNSLPVLTGENIAAIDHVIESYDKRVRTKPTYETPSGSKVEDVRAALSFIPADDYDLWIRIGMALRSEFSFEGFSLWDAWSQTSGKYNPLEMAKKWDSFNGVRDINIATLFFKAQECGYRAPKRERKIQQRPLVQSERVVPDLSIPNELVESAPGLVGRIAQWINETSIFKQPALALGASLTAVAALKAHRVRTSTNLRTNLYVLGISNAGTGKGRAMEQIEELFNAAGLLNLFSGEPVSDSGLLKSLHMNKGRRLLQWDEIGIALEEMTNKKAAGHRAAILRVIMELFSKSGGTFRGKEYANHDGKSKRQDLEQPCLSVYGASTPETFYGSLSSRHVVDGFISRLIIFQSGDPYPKRRSVGITDVPPELISEVQNIEKLATNDTPQGNLDEATKIRPRVVGLTPKAEITRADALGYFDSQREVYGDKSDALASIWSRAGEHMMKVALVVEDGDSITEKSMQWSRQVMEHCTKQLTEMIPNKVADNEYQRSLNRVLEIVRKQGREGISKKDLTQRTRWLKIHERDEILANLAEGELVAEQVLKTHKKPAVFYIAQYPETE